MFGKILAVDDEPLVLKSIERALAKVGHRMVTATGEDIQAGKVPLGGFDLLIMDLHMLGLKTSDIVDDVRAENPDLKVLYISGMEPGELDGEFLQKPFSIGELRWKVSDLLSRARGG